MTKRKDMLRVAFNAPPDDALPPTREGRIPASAVRAMGLSLGRISEEAARTGKLEAMLATGEAVHDIDPRDIDPSFIDDRLARSTDPDFRRLVESISASGQHVPILVRPHPDRPGRYQVAYGHRRLIACAELGKPVKAVVRNLADADLVVAQGKENAERRNLTFIERAVFAVRLEERGFDRATVQAALAVHPAEMTRLLAVGHSVPSGVVVAIGPAPKAGRPRWMKLAALLGKHGRPAGLSRLMKLPSFTSASSDQRFALCLTTLESEGDQGGGGSRPSATTGSPLVRAERTAHTVRLTIDVRKHPGLDEHLLAELPALIARFTPK